MEFLNIKMFKDNVSIMDASKIFFKNIRDKTVLAKDYLNFISNITGYSYESVRGSTIGYQYPKLGGQDWFKMNWTYMRSTDGVPARFVKGKDEIPLGNSYNHETKHKSRQFVFRNIRKLTNPKVLTLAGHEGLDVKYIFKQNKNARIFNVEKHFNILREYKKHKLPTHDMNTTISTFIRSIDQTFDHIFYDSVSYLCGYIANDLEYINDNKMTKIISVNLMDMNGIRNHGRFANYMREKFKSKKNKTLAAVKYIMSNYRYIGSYGYKCGGNSIGMRILKFELVE